MSTAVDDRFIRFRAYLDQLTRLEGAIREAKFEPDESARRKLLDNAIDVIDQLRDAACKL